jgi:hypothetical protein
VVRSTVRASRTVLSRWLSFGRAIAPVDSAFPHMPRSILKTRVRHAMRDDGGFALLAVLLVLALLAVLGIEFGRSVRLEAQAVRTFKDVVIGNTLRRAHSPSPCEK